MIRKRPDELVVALYLKILRSKYEYGITLSDACRRCGIKPTSFPSLKKRVLSIIRKYSNIRTVKSVGRDRFKLGGAIVLEDLNLRHIKESLKRRRGSIIISEKLYHSNRVDINGKVYITENCDNMDEAGICRGHPMSREDFINMYCNGIEPPTLEYDND